MGIPGPSPVHIYIPSPFPLISGRGDTRKSSNLFQLIHMQDNYTCTVRAEQPWKDGARSLCDLRNKSPRFALDDCKSGPANNLVCSVPAFQRCEVEGFMSMAHKIMSTPPLSRRGAWLTVRYIRQMSNEYPPPPTRFTPTCLFLSTDAHYPYNKNTIRSTFDLSSLSTHLQPSQPTNGCSDVYGYCYRER